MESGDALYSPCPDVLTGSHSQQKTKLERTMGKGIWHQITTVVVLRKNMRQKDQSEADKKSRAALENMRYGACTQEDISFLKTLIADRKGDRDKLLQSQFRDVSIIVSKNSQRDSINDVGCERYASENGRRLHSFWAEDEPSLEDTDPGEDMRDLRECLSKLPPAATEHRAGQL